MAAHLISGTFTWLKTILKQKPLVTRFDLQECVYLQGHAHGQPEFWQHDVSEYLKINS